VPQDAAVAMMMDNLSSMASRDPVPIHLDIGHEYVYQVGNAPGCAHRHLDTGHEYV
jgi:hypothetical protein